MEYGVAHYHLPSVFLGFTVLASRSRGATGEKRAPHPAVAFVSYAFPRGASHNRRSRRAYLQFFGRRAYHSVFFESAFGSCRGGSNLLVLPLRSSGKGSAACAKGAFLCARGNYRDWHHYYYRIFCSGITVQKAPCAVRFSKNSRSSKYPVASCDVLAEKAKTSVHDR